MVDTYSLRDKLNEFEPWQRAAILNNTAAIQLTSHCTVGCKDCGLDAIIGPARTNQTIAWDFLVDLQKEFGEDTDYQRISFYFKSDPFDFASQGRTYRDVHLLYSPASKTVTSVPVGKEDEIVASLDIIKKISIHDANRTRATKLRERVLQLDPEYAKLFDERPRDKVGPQHIPAPDPKKYHFNFVTFHGVVLTPNGVTNIQTVPVTAEYPFGFVQTNVTPQNFKIHALTYSPVSSNTFRREIVTDHYDWISNPFEITSQDTIIRPPFDFRYQEFFRDMQHIAFVSAKDRKKITDHFSQLVQDFKNKKLTPAEALILERLAHVEKDISNSLKKTKRRQPVKA